MNIYNLSIEINIDLYKRILLFAAQLKSRIVFIIREPEKINKEFFKLMENEKLLFFRNTKEWPGTISLKEYSLYCYEFDEGSVCRITGLVPELWDWISPDFPEDISFLRTNGKPWFISITHEKDCYFILDESEKKVVENILGENLLILQESIEESDIIVVKEKNAGSFLPNPNDVY